MFKRFMAWLEGEQPKLAHHHYFDRLWINPQSSPRRWSAEMDLKLEGVERPLTIDPEAFREHEPVIGPTDSEVSFCRRTLAALHHVFQICRPAIGEHWKNIGTGPLPQRYTDGFSLFCFSIPAHGDEHRPWEISWEHKGENCMFTLQVEGETAVMKEVDTYW